MIATRIAPETEVAAAAVVSFADASASLALSIIFMHAA